MRSSKFTLTVISAAVAVVAGIAAVIVTVVLPSSAGTSTTGFVPTSSSPAQDARQITSAFITAWQKGDLEQAARYTDRPAAAQAALVSYRKYLHLVKLTGATNSAAAAPAPRGSASSTPGAANTPRESVRFAINATVTAKSGAKALTGTWSYHSSLIAYQQPNSQTWYIAWAPDNLAPNLTTATHLASVVVPPHITTVTDNEGRELSTYGDAGLTTIAGLLQNGSPVLAKGQFGLQVQIQTAAGKPVPDMQATVITAGEIPGLTTTINAQAEAAAMSAVKRHKNSSMVAIQPSTGHILAIANNAGFNDFALTAAVAPGSTGKIISATALLAGHVITPDSQVSCPQTYTVQGVVFHNDNNETEPGSTPFTTDFAQSCNNAFAQWWRNLENGRLAAAAKNYYGLNQAWDLGLGHAATYYNTPSDASGAQVAMEAFGGGAISASPLAIASVGATVDSGTFRQPILVPGTKQLTATPLPASTRDGLKQMMRAVVTSGTAAGLGFGPDVYAKTGTADTQGQQQPNSWIVAFDSSKDVAVACLVLNAGYGAQFAGPEVQSFLSHY